MEDKSKEQLIPRPLTRFWYTFLTALQCLDAGIRPLCDSLLDHSEADRNSFFSVTLSSMLDVQRQAVAEMDTVREWSKDHRAGSVIAFYTPLMVALFDGIAEVLRLYGREEQICILEHRHQFVHGPRQGVAAEVRTVHWLAPDGPRSERITNREINDILIAIWSRDGVDGFMTKMRMRLGRTHLLFWEIYGSCRVIRHHGIFDKHMRGWDDFDPRDGRLQYSLLNDSYHDTATARAGSLMSFYEFAASAGPKEPKALDPFTEEMRRTVRQPGRP